MRSMSLFKTSSTKLIVSTLVAWKECYGRRVFSITAALVTLTFVSTSGQAANIAETGNVCEALKGQMIGGASIADAALVSSPPGGGDDFCKVVGRIHGTLGYEIHMPVQWNKKLVYVGGGGFDGA